LSISPRHTDIDEGWADASGSDGRDRGSRGVRAESWNAPESYGFFLGSAPVRQKQRSSMHEAPCMSCAAGNAQLHRMIESRRDAGPGSVATAKTLRSGESFVNVDVQR